MSDEWEAMAAGTAAAAREGLSDAHQLTDFSAALSRRVAQLRATLATHPSPVSAEGGDA